MSTCRSPREKVRARRARRLLAGQALGDPKIIVEFILVDPPERPNLRRTKDGPRLPTMPNSKRPTQSDVARIAGVSRGTVSLVLNNRMGQVSISLETQKRVLAAARQLGYAPNPVAQMLASGRNRIIGFFAFEGTFPYGQEDFHHPYLVGVEHQACERDFDLLLFTRHSSGDSKRIYKNGMNSLRLADGTIFVGNNPADTEGFERLLAERYPFVLIGRASLPRGRIDTIVHDHRGAARRVTDHLLALGHRRLAFLAQAIDSEFIVERLEGCQAVAAAGNATLFQICGAPAGDAKALARRLRVERVSALLCADRRCLPATRMLMSGGTLRVPSDLSVAFLVTTDDEFYADATRVLLDRSGLGRAAFDRLVARIEGRLDGFEEIRMGCELVTGWTTAQAP